MSTGRSSSSATSRRFRNRVIVVLLVLTALVLVVLAIQPSQGLPEGVLETGVETRSLQIEVRAQGVLRAEGEISVFAEAAGTVLRISDAVNESGEVEAGDWVVRLDDGEARRALEEAEASLLAALADLNAMKVRHTRAGQERDRANRLHREELIARDERDDARATFDELAAQLATTEAQVEQARIRRDRAAEAVEKTWVRTPVAGEILNVFVRPGQPVVAGGEPVFVVAPDLERLELVLEVNETDIGRVHRGQQVRFTVDAFPGRQFDGEVSRVRSGGQRRGGVAQYEIIARVSADRGTLLPGMSSQARIDTGASPEQPVIPLRALLYRPDDSVVRSHQSELERLRSDGQAVIWIRREDSAIEPVGVRLGDQDEDFVALSDPWEHGEDARVLYRE